MSRRDFLGLLGGVGAAGLLLGGGWALSRGRTLPILTSPTFSDYPFTLGVASGEPRPDRVILWTRLAPDPLNGGGMPPNDVEVRWEMATDENFKNVVRSGTEIASAHPTFSTTDHSVHVARQGLEPSTYYWYRFKVGDEISPVGRTKTAPPYGVPLSSLKFAFASCADYQEGYFPAYRAIAEDEDLDIVLHLGVDIVLHLGDYIYESGPDPDSTRTHETPGPTDLESYRNRYAEYRVDPALQAAHAMHPWEVIWDDHEAYNNVEGSAGQSSQTAEAALAYWEHMPLRPAASPQAAGGPDLVIYRDIEYGDLVQFNMLDTRQYREKPPDPGRGGRAPDPDDPDLENDMIGPDQETWLLKSLASSGARWNVLGNQIGMFDYQSGSDGNIMGWDGHGYGRDRIMRFLDESQPSNPVVITGDLHCSWVSDLKADFRDENSDTVGTEFIGTSITAGLGQWYVDAYEGHLDQNPHVRFFDERTGGYVRCEVTPEECRMDMKLADSIKDPASPVRTFASFVVEDGKPGAERV